MHFGENQLSRSLISLSPLHSAHPPGFQPRWVRSSTRFYTCLNLAKRRSPRFGSTSCDSTPYSDSEFPYGYPTQVNLATQHNSQAHSSIGTPSPHKALTDCKRPISGTISLPSRGTFHHSLTVLSTIGHQEVFRLTKRSLQIQDRLHESAPTRGHAPTQHHAKHLRGYHPLRPAIPDSSTKHNTKGPAPIRKAAYAPTTPNKQRPYAITLIRFSHPPLSLATTHGISSPAGTKMFHFPTFPPHPYQFRIR